jgi:N-acetyl-gamma-glutamyl-phosphate reductase
MKYIAIIGAAGYTGGELIRLLLNHPEVELTQLISRSQNGKLVSSVHQDLIGETDLVFQDQLEGQIDVLFLCMGHGASKLWLAKNEIDKQTLIIDLSSDFRFDDNFVYGLSEWSKATLTQSKQIANPGCFATAIQLALLPMVKAGAIESDVQIQAITGSTGAGQNPSNTSHFSWRNQNISVYKAFTHQHLAEVDQSIQKLDSNFSKELIFIPMRGNYSKGIFSTICFKTNLPEALIYELYESTYSEDAFVHISKVSPNLKQVVNTNKNIIYIEKNGNYVMLISMIDNLIKGASGQAIQNMNIHFGWKENLGLQLKALVY